VKAGAQVAERDAPANDFEVAYILVRGLEFGDAMFERRDALACREDGIGHRDPFRGEPPAACVERRTQCGEL
jgi:hypothetical protein